MAASPKPESTAVAAPASRGLVGLLESEQARQIIEPMLPPGVDYRRVVQEVYMAGKDNPDLLTCTRESIVRAVARAESWGLTIGETVHLVPFNVKVKEQGQADRWEKRCQALQDYKGKIELIVRSGSARSVDADNVYENDLFEYEQGAHPICRHRPVLDPAKRGAFLGSYALARLRFGNVKVTFVPASEIEAVRQRYSKQWKNGELPYWYGPKTAVHRLAKMLPKSEKLARVMKAFLEEELDEQLVGVIDNGPIATLGAPPERVHNGPKALAAAPADDPYGEEPPAESVPSWVNEDEEHDGSLGL
ncbi:MAG: RecT protein [Gemmatimonadetes bacterium]|nr:RecT protein [Gemmatimonadota bacterium]